MSFSNAAAKLADEMLGKRDVAQHSTQPDVSGTETMKAIVWKSAKQVACEDKPVPRVTHPEDVVVRVTKCTVCSGSDSHIYAGEVITTDEGLILGHEACGVVHQVGPGVTKFKRGDRVVIAFDIACGSCEHCQKQEFTGCDRTNDSRLFEEMYGGPPAAAIYGYSRLMGNIPGSQAEFVRVPFADVNLYPIPDDVPDEKALFVSDVLSTSLHAVEMGCVREGDVVAIWGLGPIGLYAAAWAKIKGAKRVIGIDLVPERLRLARDKFGVEVMDRSDLTSTQLMSKLRNLLPQGGVDVAIDATGFRFSQSWTHTVERALGMETDTPETLVECVTLVRKFGHVSVIADYIGYANHFPIGHIMMKHLTVRSGQCPVQKYFKYVMENVQNGTIDPMLMVTHRLTLDEVPKAYEQLFYKTDGCIKVLIDVDDQTQQRRQRVEGQGVAQGIDEKMRHMGEKMQGISRVGDQGRGVEEHFHPHPQQHGELQQQYSQQQSELQQQQPPQQHGGLQQTQQHHDLQQRGFQQQEFQQQGFQPQNPQQYREYGQGTHTTPQQRTAQETHATQQPRTAQETHAKSEQRIGESTQTTPQQHSAQSTQTTQETQEKEPSMMTKAMQALHMTSSGSKTEPEPQQQQQQQQKRPVSQQLRSDEPTHEGELDIP